MWNKVGTQECQENMALYILKSCGRSCTTTAQIPNGSTQTFTVSYLVLLSFLGRKETITLCIYHAGFDPELLAFVPQPVAAIIFLYPITETSEQHRREEEAKLKKREQDISPNVVFFKQTVKKKKVCTHSSNGV